MSLAEISLLEGYIPLFPFHYLLCLKALSLFTRCIIFQGNLLRAFFFSLIWIPLFTWMNEMNTRALPKLRGAFRGVFRGVFPHCISFSFFSDSIFIINGKRVWQTHHKTQNQRRLSSKSIYSSFSWRKSRKKNSGFFITWKGQITC